MPAPLTPAHNACLHRFAVLTAVATLGLVGIGGLVTSHGAGMAVPDWPNTYGYNMFFFPISQWVGGIFYEHTHRLVASGIGLLTIVLALWLYGRTRPPVHALGRRCPAAARGGTAVAMPRRWADGLVLGLTGLALLGASWVWPRCEPSAEMAATIGARGILCRGAARGARRIARGPVQGRHRDFPRHARAALLRADLRHRPLHQPLVADAANADSINRQRSGYPTLYLLATLLILAQLTLGAAMRHQHAGLAIPDFPLAYGKLWPAMDAASVAHYNQQRIEVVAANPITAFQIGLADDPSAACAGDSWRGRLRRVVPPGARSAGRII